MNQIQLYQIQRYFDQLDDYKEIIPTNKITEDYAIELLDEVERLRAALQYIGTYNSNKLNHHYPNAVEFHLKEVARENLECNVDYRDHIESL